MHWGTSPGFRSSAIAIAVGGLTVAVSGCVTEEMNKGLMSLVGQNVQFVVGRLGYPNGQREVMGDTVYVWSTNRNVSIPMATTTTTTGMVGSTPVFGTTTGTSYVQGEFDCTIEVGAGADDVIKTWHWEGNMGGCQGYASALSR